MICINLTLLFFTMMLSVLKKNLTFLVLILLFVGCKPVEAPNKLALNTTKCLANQSPCFVDDELGKFAITFNVEEVRAEVPFTIFVNYQANSDYTLKNVVGFLEGKTMFMGKIPLFFHEITTELTSQVFNAETMVVACSEPNMVWNLWITATLTNRNNSSVEKKILINFSSRY